MVRLETTEVLRTCPATADCLRESLKLDTRRPLTGRVMCGAPTVTVPHCALVAVLVALAASAVSNVSGLGLDWATSQWGQCDKSCGGGFQLRQLHCLDNFGQLAQVSGLCGGQLYDQEIAQQCNTEDCGFFYIEIGEWSVCSQPCDSGVRARQQTCMTEGNQEASSKSLCSGLSPNTGLSEPCNTAACPASAARWSVGQWAPCNSTCGPGTSTRSVKCLDSQGSLSEGCEGPGPSSQVSCESAPCGLEPCALCGGNTAECTVESETATTCVCQKGWAGPRCTVPQSCESGVLDDDGNCCASGILDGNRQCCQGQNGGSPPVTDRNGQCCASAELLDACGVCGGSALSLDILGVCCPGPLDAAGYCCASGYLDACQVCDGDRQPGTTCEPTCGNNICEGPEGPWGSASDSCGEDCPLEIQTCPRGALPSLGGALNFCSGHGACLIGTAACDCHFGYSGEACDSCAGGWEQSPAGFCVRSPEIVILEENPPPEPTPEPSPAPSGPVISITVAIVLVVVGAVLVLALVALLFAVCCLRGRAVDSLQLFPVLDAAYKPRPGAQMSQVTVFTPGAVTRKPYPNEPGWKPMDPALNLWLGSAPSLDNPTGDTSRDDSAPPPTGRAPFPTGGPQQPTGYRVSTPTGILGSRASTPLAIGRAPGSTTGVQGILASLPPAVRRESLPKLRAASPQQAANFVPGAVGSDVQLTTVPSLEASGVVGSFEVPEWPPRLAEQPQQGQRGRMAASSWAPPCAPSTSPKPGAGVFIERPSSKQGTTRPSSVASAGDVALLGATTRPSSSQQGTTRPGSRQSTTRPGSRQSPMRPGLTTPPQGANRQQQQKQQQGDLLPPSGLPLRGKSVRFPREYLPPDEGEPSSRPASNRTATARSRASQRSLLGGLSSLFSGKTVQSEETDLLEASSKRTSEKTMGEIISDMPLPLVMDEEEESSEIEAKPKVVRLPSILSSASTGFACSEFQSEFQSQGDTDLMEDTGRLAVMSANYWAGDDDD